MVAFTHTSKSSIAMKRRGSMKYNSQESSSTAPLELDCTTGVVSQRITLLVMITSMV